MKRCTKCGIEKEYSAFSFHRGDLYPSCKQCAAEYTAANKERIAAYHKEWYATAGKFQRRASSGRFNFSTYSLAYREAHREEARARTAEWRRRNPSATKTYAAARRTRKTEAGGSFTSAEWAALKARYGNQCLCCGVSEEYVPLAADHVIPVSKGGSSDISNIQPLCKSCNSQKYTKAIDYRF